MLRSLGGRRVLARQRVRQPFQDQGGNIVSFVLHISYLWSAKMSYADSSQSSRRRSASTAQTWSGHP